ncbi:MAG: TetR family transcriptional regulator [Acidobacteria bacterium]|nr:TetR family transcriptional regulator [Acidobacteriota bacterium]
MTVEQLATKQRILETAEGLFAESGFDGTSLRAITTKAGVNLAAVNYHFRSKDELIQAVFARRLEPINRRRLELLDECTQEAGEGPLPLEKIVRAFLRPAVEIDLNRPELANFKTLMGRLHTEPKGLMKDLLEKQFGEVISKYLAAFHRALPHLPEEEIFWRTHFMVGSMAHTLACSESIEFVSGGRCDISDLEGTLERLVSYSTAGMRSPVLKLKSQKEKSEEDQPQPTHAR